jgi:hypothetical protein
LKTVPHNGMDILHNETGEIQTLYPPTKTSTSTIFVTLK